MPSDQTLTSEPGKFYVSVIMQRETANNPWVDFQWQVIGVSAGKKSNASNKAKLVYEKNDTRRYLLGGFELNLYKDECESYYHNLVSPTPRCYIICHQVEEGMPEPFLVTLSFDAAHSYLEGEEEVFAVEIPAEIYQLVEAFVVNNYVPQKRVKRKRDDWKKQLHNEVSHEVRH